MSRSRRRTPITGITTASSEKQDKRLANRKLRRVTNEMLRGSDLEDDLTLPDIREVSNVYSFAKDGKCWHDPDDPRNRKILKK
jgi:hypothetical protein